MSRYAVAVLGLVLIPAMAAPGAGGELPERVFAAAPEDAIQNLVFFGEDRPVFMRLRVTIEDQGFRLAWDEFVDRLRHFLDVNGDGTLTPAETRRGSWSQVLRSPFGNNAAPGLEQRVFSRLGSMTIDSQPRDGQVSREELARYLRESLSFNEFSVQSGSEPDRRTQALFGLLDADGDGRLSDADLAIVDRLTARLDRDGNEKLDADELRPDLPDSSSRRFFGQPQGGGSTTQPGPVVAVAEPTRSAVMRRLLEHYDRPGPDGSTKNRKLDAIEMGLAPETLRKFDRNEDGALEALEIEEFLMAGEPAFELIVALAEPRPNPSRSSLEVRPMPGSSVKVRSRDGMQVAADLGDALLEVRNGDQTQNFGTFIEQQFNAADADKNGYVDTKEAAQNGFVNQFFAAADRDGDGKLFKIELDAYVERQTDAQKCRTTLTVTDCGRALFEVLDTDRDGMLGLRELRATRQRLIELERGSEGGITADSIPRRYELVIARGAGAAQQGVRIETYDSSPRATPERSRDTPGWFRRMDRNADGDVSPREFLGPLAEFRRLDADGDGLIDPTEAQR